MESNSTCNIEPAITYNLKGHDEVGIPFWACITLREWNKGGSVDIQSDYGSYSYSWHNIGEKPLRDFLPRLSFGYFMEKACGSSYMRFDTEATKQEILQDILKYRREGISKEDARELWDDAQDFSDSTEDSFFASRFASDLCRILYDHEWAAIPCVKSPTPEALGFWKVIWPCICDVLRGEIENASHAPKD